ncbi:MAG: PrsW family intramembrane metalloprotease, partial [Propionibacteriaceae bacterium]|nr:PrsW family intramembrane metalloprotease [Propionibacteriaceae bacterium]
RANGLPVEPTAAKQHWARRILTNPWMWILIGATLIYAGCLWWMYDTSVQETVVEGGVIPGLNASAIKRSANLALPTLAAWVVLFLALDRFRPARPILWWLALGWGASVSTAASMVINTWAGQEMAIVGPGDPATGARTAVFVAPFVEEATKATILFLIAMALRYRLVTRIQGVALAGLSGAGFAFTENILYYSRAIVYASATIEAGDPEAALAEIVLLRGLKTAFGHPLFTVLAGIALVVALRSSSKVVRILAPLAGYLVASLAHMVFNFLASTGMDPTWMAIIGWLITFSVAIHLIRQVLAEGRRHAHRLNDYVLMGWLPSEAVVAFSRQRTRWRSLLNAASRGWRPLLATSRLQRTMSELVHLRDQQLHGLVDAAGDGRARELLDRARSLWPLAVTDPTVQRFQFPRLPNPMRWLRERRAWRDPRWAPPGQVPTATGAGPLGSPEYSPVDPRWAPPKG